VGKVMRAGAATVGVLALAGCWCVPGQNFDRTAYNSVEAGITPATVGGLVEAWRARGPDPSLLESPAVTDPVVSDAGVHAMTGECTVLTVDAVTGAQRWATTLSTGYCTPLAPVEVVQQHSPPFVVGDHILAGVYIWDPDIFAPSFPFPVYVTAEIDAESGQNVAPSAPGVITAGVRGRTAVATTPLIEAVLVGPPPGIPYYVGRDQVNGFATVGSLDDPAQRRTIRLAARVSDVWVSQLPTLGAESLFHAGGGTLATQPGDAALGFALRAYPLDATPSDCGVAPAVVTCPGWVAPLDTPPSTLPVIAPDQGTVYVGTEAGTLYAVDAASGAVEWTAALGARVGAAPALAEGTLYVPTADGRVAALAAGGCGAATCAPLWEASTGSAIRVQPAVAGGVVYTGSADGSVDGFPAAGCGAPSCAPLWSAEAGSGITGAPAVSIGQLYVGTEAGDLVAYRLG
jgi:PQQ-like domain